jgi:glycine betaine/proline transport system ATP-binding protein
VLLDLQKEIRKTIVFITHDLDEALRLGDRICILKDGEIVQQGSGQDIVLRPANYYIFDFVREVNRGRVIEVDSVMTPVEDRARAFGVTVPAGSVLEIAMKTLSEANANLAGVVDAAGGVIGSITLDQVVKAMITPKSAS